MRLRWIWLAVLVVLLVLPTCVFAQASTTSQLVWDQNNVPDVATAQSYTYRYYADAQATTPIVVPSVGVALTVTCVAGTAPVVATCSAPFPAFTPGAHTLALSAGNPAGESGKSTVLSFTFLVLPSAPASVRIR